ncbi:MAG: hypothetical protein K2F74_06090, partial [Muribaculaceae bacterium]|nr:hypothetical protein [Muribaculaceae bacterium]
DGALSVTIRAAVFLSGCSCSAAGRNGGTVSRTVTIIDNDGPSLSMAASRSTLRKDSRTTELTISRNTPVTSAQEVRLSADTEGILSMPELVVIPAGKKEVRVPVEALDGAFHGEEMTVSVNASANGFSKGICLLLISDRTLPDAVPGAISLDSYEVMPGGDIRVSAEIRNDGNALMPDAATVDFFISGQNTFTATAMTSAPIAPAGKATVTAVIKAPSVPGRYGLTARVNDAVTFAELTAANNASETVWFTVLSPFMGSAATDRSVYNTGDEVTITGRTPSYSGEVEVYVTDGSIREAIAATAEADGSFSVKWTPRSGGAYAAGVCVPGEKKTDAMCEFDVRGLKFAESSYITFDMTCGDSRTVNLTVRNMSPVALENISLTSADVPDNCRVTIGDPVSIDAYSSAEIPLTVEALEVSPGSDWQTFRLTVSDGDGLADTKTMYYYGRSARASLLSSVSSINTSMTMGQTRTYSFVIANNGKAATGDITLSLPAFMRMQTAATLPSLEHGEKAEVVLSMTPSPEMQLNVPVSGQIGVNCAYGDGLAIPYSVEPVSDATGRLVVDARDEYTFYTEEAPHVAGADVMVSHPVTGRMIEKGKTGEDGVWACELPAGYYKIDVSADRHSSWSGTLEIAAGRDNDVPVFLGFNAISYSWTVEETTVDDTYEIVNTVEFETRVPKPVILVNFPELTYSNQIAYITVTNKGLIEAHNVHVLVPESDAAISFELLGDNLYETLGAGQSIFVPMRVSVPYEDPEQKLRMSTSSYSYTAEYDASEAAASSAAAPAMAAARASSGECKAHPCYVLVDDYDCDPLTGEPIYNGKKKAIEGTYYTGNCSGPGLPGFGGGGWRPGGSGWGIGDNTTYNPPPSRPGVKVDSDKNSTYLPDRLRTILTTGCLSNCEKALADAIKACWDAVQSCRNRGDWADFDPQECAENLIDACLPDEPAETMDQAIDQSLDCGKNAAGCFPPLACPADVFDCIRKAYKAFQECMKLYKHLHQDQAPALNGKAPALNDDQALEQAKELRAESVDLMARMYLARIDNLRNLLGDGNWTAATMSDIAGMLDWVQQHRDAQGYIAMDESRLQGKPATVSTATYDSFLERINNSVRSTLEGTPADNVIDLARSRSNHDEMLAVVDRIDELGYPSYDAFADAAAENFNKYLEMGKEPSAGVCASITLKFTQTLVMTRQAFRGTLSITNGNDKNAMTDIRLTLKVRDEEGNLAGEREFAITPESLDGFDGELSFTDGWSLKAGGTGEATVLFIPSRHAAPVEPRVYSFGGVLSYVDPFTGSEVSRELSPIDMTVSPSPLLDLTYFMQRDIIADDPLTADVIESQEPAEFALLIDNKGFGVGRNVRITTRQPEIVDNRKGLAIDFEIISAMLNGRNSVLALGGDVA